MTHFISLLIASALAQEVPTPEAEGFHFDGIQMEVIADIERDIHKGHEDLAAFGWYGCAFYLTHPGHGMNLGFMYTGPTFTQKVEGEKFHLWISPQVVVALNQFAHGGTGIGPSFWFELGFAHDRVNVLAGTDLYFDPRREEEMHLYGYYVVSHRPLEWLSYGAQMEVYDADIVAGPQISFHKDHLTFRIEGYFNGKVGFLRENMQVSF